MKIEEIIINLVLNGGEGKSKSMLAIECAENGDFELAEQYIKEAEQAIHKAHDFQTSLLQKEASGESEIQFSLLIVHGQDHLMNAMTVKDLAKKMINLHKKFYEEKKN